jgi:hypothetical protein
MRTRLYAARDALCLLGARARYGWRGRVAQARFPAAAESLLAGFRADAAPSYADYAGLFRYFMTGFVVRRSRLGAHADYVGLGSYNGPAMDRLEGYSRIAPLAAAWLHGGHDRHVELGDGRTYDLAALLKSGVLAGTDPASAEDWGAMRHWSQAIVEASDIALMLWLTRDVLWDSLDDTARDRIGRWLLQVNGKRIPDNNWHLFVVQVNCVLAALGQPHDDDATALHYQRAKAFYRSEGWFRDGEQDETPGYDFYNAWGFHYQLHWIDRIAPALDAAFIADALREFVGSYRFFIGAQGLPMLGRSVCYRMAAPAPLVFAQQLQPPGVTPGVARRALDAVWQYFIRQGALRQGNVTQGYLEADPRLLEDYSGPASCLWSLRSLVAAFALPAAHPFWSGPAGPLPVEQGDYRVAVGPTGWTVCGSRASGEVAIETGRAGRPALQPVRLAERLFAPFFLKPCRPKNLQAKYHRARYASGAPLGTGEET